MTAAACGDCEHLGGLHPGHGAGANPPRERHLHHNGDPHILHRRRRRRTGETAATAAKTAPATATAS